ncbi:MAG: hypothetical protein SF066_11195 [Thermoanaerobaculia bacterium]|nr:hypothetical protein [Thermoanaerobaculia bacterium]
MLAEGARLSLEENLLWIQEINRFAALLKPMAAAGTGEAALTRKSTISARTSFAHLLPSL